jgi:CTP synthase (UTP-ammonia lyase)
MKPIGIIAEYTPTFEPHVATSAAIEHSGDSLGISAPYEWISTADISDDFFERYGALWVAPGSPYKNMEKTLWAIRFARENGVPTLGTCGGFQHIMIEYARNLLGIADAQHAEYDPYASNLFISELACSLAGKEMELSLHPESRIAEIYGSTHVGEKYYCNFAVNPEFIETIQNGPISVTGSDAEGEVRIIEYSEHVFFIATLFVPQARSKQNYPHPLVNAFLDAAYKANKNAGAGQ